MKYMPCRQCRLICNLQAFGSSPNAHVSAGNTPTGCGLEILILNMALCSIHSGDGRAQWRSANALYLVFLATGLWYHLRSPRDCLTSRLCRQTLRTTDIGILAWRALSLGFCLITPRVYGSGSETTWCSLFGGGAAPVGCILSNGGQGECMTQALAPRGARRSEGAGLQQRRQFRQRAVARVHTQSTRQHLDHALVLTCTPHHIA